MGRRCQAGLTLAVCLLIPILALALNWAACNRRADTIPEDYVRDTFAEIGPNGLLLTRDWQLYAPALYLQQVEGLRPDLAVIDTELLRRGWYFRLLHRRYPDLMASVAAEERAFLALRDAWERGDIPDGDPRIAQLQAAYVALLDAFIDRAAAAGRPVHAGPNRGADPIRGATLNGQPDMEPGIGAAWQWLPVGLSFRASPGRPYPARCRPWPGASRRSGRCSPPRRNAKSRPPAPTWRRCTAWCRRTPAILPGRRPTGAWRWLSIRRMGRRTNSCKG